MLALAASGSVFAQADPTLAQTLLHLDNYLLMLIDHQPRMAFVTRSIDRVELHNNVTGIAKEHVGSYGLGIIYAKEMRNAKEGESQ